MKRVLFVCVGVEEVRKLRSVIEERVEALRLGDAAEESREESTR